MVGGIPGSGPGNVGGQLPAAVEEEGHYNVIVPGSDGENPLRHAYRSSTGPLRIESDVGGVAVAAPQDDGVRMAVDLTPDDVYGGSGVMIGAIDIDDVAAIHFETSTEVVIALGLGIAYNDGTLAEWEDVGDGRERRVGFDGDDRALSGYVAGQESPITRDQASFGSPPNGAAGPLQDVSIADIQDEFGNIPVSIAASVDGGSGESRQAVVERLEAELRG